MKVVFAAVAGFAVAFVFLTSSAFQASTVARSWPPHPKSIVNWLKIEDLPAPATLPGLSELVLLQVPSDRWLVITDLEPIPTLASPDRTEIRERLGATSIVKHTFRATTQPKADFEPRDVVGLTFRPGSQVVLANTISTDLDLATGWRWAGYYTH